MPLKGDNSGFQERASTRDAIYDNPFSYVGYPDSQETISDGSSLQLIAKTGKQSKRKTTFNMPSQHIYNPQFSTRRSLRVTLTSPTRQTSMYDLVGDSRTKSDALKPRLLSHVVHEEEMKSIVSRLTRPTISTRMRAVNFRPQTQYTFVDMGHYSWNRMSLYTDYQRQMYTNLGAIQPGFKRTVKATYRPVYC